MAKMTRNDLADWLAIDRAEYEVTVESQGYGPDAMQEMIPFIKAAAFQIAKHRPVAGMTVNHGEYGATYTSRIDWKKLATAVEKRTKHYKPLIERERMGAT